MITVKDGVVLLKGEKPILLAELSGIVEALLKIGIKKDEINFAVSLANLSDEELHIETEKAIMKFENELLEEAKLKAVSLHIASMPEDQRKNLEEMLHDNKV